MHVSDVPSDESLAYASGGGGGAGAAFMQFTHVGAFRPQLLEQQLPVAVPLLLLLLLLHLPPPADDAAAAAAATAASC